ncbi:hypothetical protein SNEBB_007107 [Seison nebaliae]|nr:hypothetical protein SNEBB_007107 [Seison nebaliae]
MDNQRHKGAYGLMGDYVISKHFTADEKRHMRINPNVVGLIIREKSVNAVSSSDRLHMLIADMIMIQLVEGFGDFYEFAYYPTIEVLNIELETENVKHDPIDVTSFQPGYYADIGQETIDNIRKDLTEKKITPKVIHLGFAPQHHMRIHEMTYTNFASFLDGVKDLEVEKFPPPNFKVHIQAQIFTLPKINNNDNLYYSFPTANGDSNYQLKAASFFIQEEYVAFPKDFIEMENSSPSVRQCIQNFFKKMDMYVNMGDLKNLDFFNSYTAKYIKYFYAMCNAVFDVNFYKTFVREEGIHSFSINRRGEGWVLMNDQHSFKIDYIGHITELLKNEVLDAVVLEMDNKKKIE